MPSLGNKDGQSGFSYSFDNDMAAKQRKITETLRRLQVNLLLGHVILEPVQSEGSGQEVALDDMIDLFLQCKHLYSLYGEVKKILILVLRQEEIFNNETGVIQMIMRKQSQIED